MVFGIVFITLILAVFTYGFYKIASRAWEDGKPLDYKKDVKLTGKIVLITGANCGLGKATALDLAARGARVILACRNKEKAEIAAEEIKSATGNQDVSIVILDLSDLDSVKAAAENVIKTYDRLDVLINNAGIGLNDQETTKQGFDMIFGTNYLGHFLFTQILLDLLKKSTPSRIINVSSTVLYVVWKKLNYDPSSENKKVKYPNLQGYPISKLANYFHVRSLADELKGTGVTANAVHPGCVQTEIAKRNIENKTKAFLNKIFLWIFKLIGRSERDGSQTIVHVAVDPDLEEVTGEFFMNLTLGTDQLAALAKDWEEAKKLSKFSYDVCQNYLPIKPLVAQDTANEKTNDDQKEDEQEEKTESLLKPVVDALTPEAEDISIINKSACVESFSAILDDKISESSPVNDDITVNPSTTVPEETSTANVDE